MDFDKGKLFVGGISQEVTKEILREHFSKYGKIIDSVVMREKYTGRTRGFGFVQFYDSSDANKALQDKHVLLQRKVDVKRAEPRHQQQQQQKLRVGLNTNDGANDQLSSNKIFVGGLSREVTEEDFKSYFGEYGSITDLVVMHDGLTGMPRGFGFITFDSEEAVRKTLETRFHTLKGKQVEVKRAVPKDDTNHRCSYDNHYNMRIGDYQCWYLLYDPYYGFYYDYMPFFDGYVYGRRYPFGSYNIEDTIIYPYGIIGNGVTNAIDRDCHELTDNDIDTECVNDNEQNSDGGFVHMLANTPKQVDGEDDNTDYSSFVENYNDLDKQVHEQLSSSTVGNLD
ncbi:Heterogeneous nuclear ribonucleoprotein [Thalictrum thalictroides]|uniref:Heterogeneous nuclear ribonucleoprotein n=1 Tax=Thalictrum thalictroides TaxID=46969 RepID=A0A7J6VC55_THATH|nr:Heterogeneous nuclear ribonucleoprotein [Thalictrum thalictroides]